MILIADHPYVACVLTLCSGVFIGWMLRTISDLVLATADEDANDITGIGA